MVLRLVEEIQKALDNDLYFVALCAALTLPDICGKVEYPDGKSSRKWYIDWYDKEIGQFEKCPKEEVGLQEEATPQKNDDEPELTGEVLYGLRCALLHEGNPNTQSEKFKDTRPIDKFILVIEKKKPVEIYGDSSVVKKLMPPGGRGDCQECYREYRMNVRRICKVLCAAASSYYRNNSDKFHFNYYLVDLDAETADYPRYSVDDVYRVMQKLPKDSHEVDNG